jgi:hypothetical protein
MEAITIPLVIALFVLGSAAGGYYAIFHGMSGGAGILIVLAVLIAILIAVQNKFPNKRYGVLLGYPPGGGGQHLPSAAA